VVGDKTEMNVERKKKKKKLKKIAYYFLSLLLRQMQENWDSVIVF